MNKDRRELKYIPASFIHLNERRKGKEKMSSIDTTFDFHLNLAEKERTPQLYQHALAIYLCTDIARKGWDTITREEREEFFFQAMKISSFVGEYE